MVFDAKYSQLLLENPSEADQYNETFLKIKLPHITTIAPGSVMAYELAGITILFQTLSEIKIGGTSAVSLVAYEPGSVVRMGWFRKTLPTFRYSAVRPPTMGEFNFYLKQKTV